MPTDPATIAGRLEGAALALETGLEIDRAAAAEIMREGAEALMKLTEAAMEAIPVLRDCSMETLDWPLSTFAAGASVRLNRAISQGDAAQAHSSPPRGE